MRRISAIALALAATVGTAAAQGSWDQFQQRMRADDQKRTEDRQRTEATKRPTKAEPMPSSLADLLTQGWRITASGMGTLGTQLVIATPRGDRWALCDLQVIDGLGSLIDPPVSRCLALN